MKASFVIISSPSTLSSWVTINKLSKHCSCCVLVFSADVAALAVRCHCRLAASSLSPAVSHRRSAMSSGTSISDERWVAQLVLLALNEAVDLCVSVCVLLFLLFALCVSSLCSLYTLFLFLSLSFCPSLSPFFLIALTSFFLFFARSYLFLSLFHLLSLALFLLSCATSPSRASGIHCAT